MEKLRIRGQTIPLYRFNTVVLGTGAAGYNAADRLWQYGQKDIAIVTENVNAGTSRNTGSDKQTYYKLSLSGGVPESVHAMAEALYQGQCVDGDHALCEAALSVPCFLRLVELGVPFPCNHYGEYVGYKTDHDPSCRATSVGPYTSRIMTECLQRSVEVKGIPVFDHLQAVRLLVSEKHIQGVLCVENTGKSTAYVAFACKNLVFATGGPAGMYRDSVYPHGHYGATGLAFEAGAQGKNLTEWQFGMASIRPRWNVSGTYMQVLPRFVSTRKDGSDVREFLLDQFKDRGEMLTKIFLKGYQWPFDVRKAISGSSVIDLLVYQEIFLKNRRVFLDFRTNPCGGEIDFDMLSEEAHTYLSKAGACFGNPIERLAHMNRPAIDFYQDKGVDLRSEMLEISLCAQHNNGGIDIDAWWHTCVEGLFAVGEAAASHGVYRPGGSALNAGQVGSMRAAKYIALRRKDMPGEARDLPKECLEQIAEMLLLGERTLNNTGHGTKRVQDAYAETTERMSRTGGAIRKEADMKTALTDVSADLAGLADGVGISTRDELCLLFRLRDTLIAQKMYLTAMVDYCKTIGLSRGSSLYSDLNGKRPVGDLSEMFCHRLDDASQRNRIQIVTMKQENCECCWRDARPIPDVDNFFENVWRDFRETQGVDN